MSACGKAASEKRADHGADAQKEDSAADKLDIVTTIFPEYDCVREIVGGQRENVGVGLYFFPCRVPRRR